MYVSTVLTYTSVIVLCISACAYVRMYVLAFCTMTMSTLLEVTYVCTCVCT